MKDNFTGYSILDWQLISFSTWKMCHFLLSSMVSVEKSSIIQIFVFLKVTHHFPLAAFQIFFFTFSFKKVMMYLGMDFKFLFYLEFTEHEIVNLCLLPIWGSCQPSLFQFFFHHTFSSVQFSSVTQSWLTLCDPMDCSTPGLPFLHSLLELAQTHVHWVSDAIQPSHPLSSPTPAFSLSQHQGLFQWVNSFHQVAKVLDLQFQHQSF